MTLKARIILVAISALARLVGPPEVARAQIPVVGQPTAADCQAGADSLTAGVPRASAWQFVSSRACGATGVTAIATAVRNVGLRAVSDTTYLNNLLTVTHAVRDMSVLTEAITLAESKTAPVAARAFALIVMMSQHRPGKSFLGRDGWRGLLSAPRGEYCRFTGGGHGGYDQALPMTSDFRVRIAGSADRISDDATNNEIVRDLAACVRLTLLEEVPPAVRPDLLSLQYVCGNRFSVRNSAAKTATLRYEVEGTSEAGDVIVDANGVAEFTADKTGTVRLLQNGAVVATAANGGTTCP